MNYYLNERIAESGGGMLQAALMFAAGAHAGVGQKRKYTDQPYITHPMEVADIVAGVPDATDEMVIAALLHDVVEDTEVSIAIISALFGDTVASYVYGLTDLYTKEAFPEMNRAERKAAEADRYSVMPYEVQTIKLADGISNTPNIAKHDPKFMATYGPEKRFLLGNLTNGNSILWWQLDDHLKQVGY